VGVVGGSLLMNGIRGLMGGHQAFADTGAFSGGGDRTPWRDQSDSTLAHDAGIDDIGRSGHRSENDSRHGFFDQASNDSDDDRDDDGSYDNDGDGFDGGDDSDVA
jgi:hypothetical protein